MTKINLYAYPLFSTFKGIKSLVMKKECLGQISGLKSAFIVLALVVVSMGAIGQKNVSYDSNHVPIKGLYCTAFGWDALKLNSAESWNNTAIGYLTLANNTTGRDNTAIGSQTLSNNTDGVVNTAVGVGALFDNKFGSFNTAIGSGALQWNTGGWDNTAVGVGALFNNTNGYNNSANGSMALYHNDSGNFITANGANALFNNLFGSNNTANGYAALYMNETGNKNLAIGDSAGFNSLGSGNTFIGHRAGAQETGSNKFYIGNEADNTLIYGDMSTRQVLLGIANPTGYSFKGSRTLNVINGILADSVRVSLSADWADYVFNDDYKVMPLNELQSYIRKNKHLPGIPTANEVKAEGIELGEMNAKLLQKIEEMTLYILKQEMRINTLEEKINMLEKK